MEFRWVPVSTQQWKARLAAGALIALAWLFLLALGLEFVESCRNAIAHRAAIAHGQKAQTYASIVRPATEEEQKVMRERGALPAVPYAASTFVGVPPPTGSSLQEIEQRYRQLSVEKSEDARDARAALDGELWLLFDSDGRLAQNFGDPVPVFKLLAPGEAALPGDISSYPFAELQPGETYSLAHGGHPMWDYVVTRMNLPDSQSGAAHSLFQIRLETVGQSIEQLAPLYQQSVQSWSSEWLIPNVSLRPNLNQDNYMSDSFGFPNMQVPLPKPANTIRIVVLGASTMPDGNCMSALTNNHLNQLLSHDFPSHTIEVLNCSMLGATTNEMRFRIRDHLSYQPDLIFYQEGVNDMVEFLRARYANLGLGRSLLLHSRLLARWCSRPLLLSEKDFTTRWDNATRRNLLAMRLAAEEQGVPMAAGSLAYVQRDQLNWTEWTYFDENARESWGAGVANYATVSRLLDLHNAKLKQLCQEYNMPYIPFAENFEYGANHYWDLCHLMPNGLTERAVVLHALLKPLVEELIKKRAGT